MSERDRERGQGAHRPRASASANAARQGEIEALAAMSALERVALALSLGRRAAALRRAAGAEDDGRD